MKGNYNDLIGDEVKVIFPSGRSFKCFVASIDYNKGITLKDLDTQKDKICLNREQSLESNTKQEYKDDFFWTLAQIRTGIIDGTKDPNSTTKGENMVCAFK